MTKRPIPIAWITCPHCGGRYDEGNAYAAFSHRNRECEAARKEGENEQ